MAEYRNEMDIGGPYLIQDMDHMSATTHGSQNAGRNTVRHAGRSGAHSRHQSRGARSTPNRKGSRQLQAH